MSEKLSDYFDEYTRKIAESKLIVRQNEKGVWEHFTIGLAVDTDPDVCKDRSLDDDGACKSCGNQYPDDEETCQCWLCDYRNEDGSLRPMITMWASNLVDPENDTRIIGDELVTYHGSTAKLILEMKRRYPNYEMINVRHNDHGDWTMGVRFSPAEVGFNRLGVLFVIPRPTPDPSQTSLVDDHEEYGK